MTTRTALTTTVLLLFACVTCAASESTLVPVKAGDNIQPVLQTGGDDCRIIAGVDGLVEQREDVAVFHHPSMRSFDMHGPLLAVDHTPGKYVLLIEDAYDDRFCHDLTVHGNFGVGIIEFFRRRPQ